MKENFQVIIESIHHPGGPDVDNVCDINEYYLFFSTTYKFGPFYRFWVCPKRC